MIPAETRYPVQEQELLAFVHCIKEWEHYLRLKPFLVLTDNESLQFLYKHPRLSKRQARWLELFMELQFTVCHIPGHQNGAADALSRRNFPDDAPQIAYPSPPPATSALRAIAAISRPLFTSPDFLNRVRRLLPSEPAPVRVLKGENHRRYTLDDGLVYLGNDAEHAERRMVLPNKRPLLLEILQTLHDDQIIGGHLGRDNTYEKVSRLFFWPNMKKFVADYVRTCEICQRVKTGRQLSAGLLQPLPPPERPWQECSLDFITSLPMTSKGFDAILVVVDRFSKMAHFIPCKGTDTARDIALLFVSGIVRLHGTPERLISDRDSKFTSQFWSDFTEAMGSVRAMSTANHPQTDGQTERTNRTLEQVLRAYTNNDLQRWDELLPNVEFVFNSMKSRATGFSPFETLYGVCPRMHMTGHFSSKPHPDMDALKTRIARIQSIVKSNLHRAAEEMKRWADKTKRDVVFEVGDMVMVHRDWITPPSIRTLTSKTRKLSPIWVGPYQVLERIGKNAYRLQLPAEARCHNVLNITAIKKYHKPQDASRVLAADPIVTEDGNVEYEVECIRTHELRRQPNTRGRNETHLWVEVAWKGYPAEAASWEPLSALTNAPQVVRRYATSLSADRAKEFKGHPEFKSYKNSRAPM